MKIARSGKILNVAGRAGAVDDDGAAVGTRRAEQDLLPRLPAFLAFSLDQEALDILDNLVIVVRTGDVLAIPVRRVELVLIEFREIGIGLGNGHRYIGVVGAADPKYLAA